ncbi:MAG TPA: alanine racemase [Syntrophobacteraceae bacterium]|nr:alanine racemase [Syntrophobacteraceae bacterium]
MTTNPVINRLCFSLAFVGESPTIFPADCKESRGVWTLGVKYWVAREFVFADEDVLFPPSEPIQERHAKMPLSWVEIDLAALRHNYLQARQRLAGSTQVLAVVKSDAYGHGMVPVARELVAAGVEFLGVSKFWEAVTLRDHGIDLPILVLLGVEPPDMEDAIRLGLHPVVYRLDQARLLSRQACRMQRPVGVHIKVDTGMGRLGVPWDQVPAFLEAFLGLPGIELQGVLSHFAVADDVDKSFSEWQLGRFRQVLALLEERGRTVRYAHIANSAGLLDLTGSHLQLVRPGLMLYGSPPSAILHGPIKLRPVMSFKSRVIQIKQVQPGDTIGYGRTHVVAKPSRIATIPVGYDDGYNRLLSNRGQVLIGGQRAPVVGRVSMNMITVDVSHIPDAREDDEVVLLGIQGEERISAEEIAGWCDTISYEILCNVGHHHFKRFLHATA